MVMFLQSLLLISVIVVIVIVGTVNVIIGYLVLSYINEGIPMAQNKVEQNIYKFQDKEVTEEKFIDTVMKNIKLPVGVDSSFHPTSGISRTSELGTETGLPTPSPLEPDAATGAGRKGAGELANDALNCSGSIKQSPSQFNTIHANSIRTFPTGCQTSFSSSHQKLHSPLKDRAKKSVRFAEGMCLNLYRE